MTLVQYIKKHGVTECARKFDVTERTVYNWMTRKGFPQRKKLAIVQRVSGLTPNQIYGS